MHHCVLESDLLDGHIFVYGCLLKLVWCGIAPLQRVLLSMSFGHNDSDDDIFGEGTLATEPRDLEPASVVEELADQSAPQEPPPPEGSCTIIAADDTSGSEDLWSQVRAKPGRKPRRERTANQKLAASLGQLAAAAVKVATLKQAGSADNSASAFVQDATAQVPQRSGVTESATPQKLVETFGLGDRLTAFLELEASAMIMRPDCSRCVPALRRPHHRRLSPMPLHLPSRRLSQMPLHLPSRHAQHVGQPELLQAGARQRTPPSCYFSRRRSLRSSRSGRMNGRIGKRLPSRKRSGSSCPTD